MKVTKKNNREKVKEEQKQETQRIEQKINSNKQDTEQDKTINRKKGEYVKKGDRQSIRILHETKKKNTHNHQK